MAKATKQPTPRTPSLEWTEGRDKALVTIMAGGNLISSEIATALKSHAEFSTVVDAITVAKVGRRVRMLRKAGVPLPRLQRARYSPDIGALKGLMSSE